MAAVRKFEIRVTSPAGDGVRMSRASIKCGACGTIDYLNGPTHLPPEQAGKKFKQRGWLVGRRPEADRCQGCKQKRIDDKMTKKDKANVFSLKNDKITAEKPPEMTFEDRRAVFMKLEEVYIDEKSGYSLGWTDQNVADDLGVPRAWVEKIRSENFGSLNISAEVRDTAKEVVSLKNDYEQLNKKYTDVLSKLNKLIADVAECKNGTDKAKARLDNLAQTARELGLA